LIVYFHQSSSLSEQAVAGLHIRSREDAAARQVEATDAAIDAVVYELYGLIEEEIVIVEGALQLE
jgi:hypothetical protein